ncbi:MAG: RNA-binding protein [Clostridiaceae bacterium]|nr:RNA-binding protein [Clostridiaceae bacterium]
MDTVIGRFAWSKAGRDQGNLFIIIDIVDDNHVLIADGIIRKLNNPKKKKIKHLKITNKFDEEISQTVLMKRKLSDVDLQKAVLRYKEELNGNNDERGGI